MIRISYMRGHSNHEGIDAESSEMDGTARAFERGYGSESEYDC